MLKDTVAIITGASSGIGAATARHLRRAGAKLVINGRRAERLTELARELGDTVAVAGDLTDPTLADRLLREALDRFGRLDTVINNAGVMPAAASIEQTDIDAICHMARVNVEACYRLALTALKHFKAQGHGDLINTSSILGTKVRPTVGAYAGSKFAIEAFTEALRMELAGSGVRVSCVEPGLVMTELHRDWPTHPREVLGMNQPLVPDDLARAILFVLEQPRHVSVPKMLVLPSEHAI